MAYLNYLAVLLFVFYAEACQDKLSPTYCKELKALQFCIKNKQFQALCKRTCGLCDGTAKTEAPTAAPTPSGPPATCGMSTVPQGRVIAGKDAKPGAWPWQIAMFINGGFACGGSLVTPEWIITAAHCVQQVPYPSYYTIRLGAHDLRTEEASTQTRKVVRIIYHPRYGNLNYDLALMKLDKPAILNDRVRTVCVPKATDVVPVGTKCFITGWGKIRHPGYTHPILQQADLPIVASKECDKLNYQILRTKITNQMVCAGHGYPNLKGGCHGDSGGPLVCQYGNGNAWTLHGAVSWGSPRCYTGDAYTVFARITSFRSWIEKYIPL